MKTRVFLGENCSSFGGKLQFHAEKLFRNSAMKFQLLLSNHFSCQYRYRLFSAPFWKRI